jgi:N-acetylglucosamine repressor
MLRGNRDLIKAMNRNLLLNILRREGPQSRTQLTDISGLSAGAVSQITTELLDNNWVLEVGEGDYTGGRRQTLLRLNPTAGYALGLKVMENRLVCAVTDFAAQVLHYYEQPFANDHDPRQITSAIANLVNTAIEGSGIPRSAVIGVGIGLAGVIDPHEGVVHYSPFFGWRNVALAQLLEDELACLYRKRCEYADAQ